MLLCAIIAISLASSFIGVLIGRNADALSLVATPLYSGFLNRASHAFAGFDHGSTSTSNALFVPIGSSSPASPFTPVQPFRSLIVYKALLESCPDDEALYTPTKTLPLLDPLIEPNSPSRPSSAPTPFQGVNIAPIPVALLIGLLCVMVSFTVSAICCFLMQQNRVWAKKIEWADFSDEGALYGNYMSSLPIISTALPPTVTAVPVAVQDKADSGIDELPALISPDYMSSPATATADDVEEIEEDEWSECPTHSDAELRETLVQEVRTLKQSLDASEQSLHALIVGAATMRSTNAEYQARVLDLEAQKASLEDKLDCQARANATLTSDARFTKQSLNQLIISNTISRQNAIQYQTCIAACETEIADLKDRLGKQGALNAALTESACSTGDELEKSQRDNACLKNVVTSLRDGHSETVANLQETIRKMDAGAEELNARLAVSKAAEIESKKLEPELDRLRQKLDEIRAELDRARTDSQRYSAESEELRQEATLKARELETSTTKITDLLAKHDETSKKLTAEQNRIKSIEKAKVAAEKEASDQKRICERTLDKLKYYKSCVTSPVIALHLNESEVMLNPTNLNHNKLLNNARKFHNTALVENGDIAKVLSPAMKVIETGQNLAPLYHEWSNAAFIDIYSQPGDYISNDARVWFTEHHDSLIAALMAYGAAIKEHEDALPESVSKWTFEMAQ